MYYGESKRVVLKYDLTDYHPHLKPGTAGMLLQGVKCSTWGSNDTFGAVKFDCCGHTRDIVLKSLDDEAQN